MLMQPLPPPQPQRAPRLMPQNLLPPAPPRAGTHSAAPALRRPVPAQPGGAKGEGASAEGYFAVGLGWLSSTFTLNWPATMAFSLAITLALMSSGIFFSKVPSGASSLPLFFIIE